jgi:uncharacterized protein YlxW (UPF0749 family)
MSQPAPAPPAPPARRLDASMSLLTELVQHPIDPGYAAAAERRQTEGEPPGSPTTRIVMMAVLAVIGLITVAAVLALRAPSPGESSAKTALLQHIRSETSAADKLQNANNALRLANDKAQADLLRLQARGQIADQIQLLGIVSGSLAVQGPGLRITISDAPGSAASAAANPRDQNAADQGRVQDRDLQTVVNGLWAAGAEAISINGQRLTALSAIRSAGQAILVDFRPLSPPYVISAIGDPDPMQALFANGTGGRYLRSLSDNFQIPSDIEAEKSLSLPPSSGLTLHSATTPTPKTAPETVPKTAPKTPTSSERPS